MTIEVCNRRAVLAIVAVALAALVGLFGAADRADARMPWWHVDTISAPADPSGGESEVLLQISNLGDALVNGSEAPVTIVDRLPAGVSPVRLYPEGGGGSVGIDFARLFTSCAISGQTITCTYSGPLLPYERLMIAIIVTVAPGQGSQTNEVHVSGGGASPVVARHALALSDAPPAYGVENYELTAEEEGGALDTQAGSHPFQLTTTFALDNSTRPLFNEYLNETLPEIQPGVFTKDLRFDLPPGLVGNPTATPECSLVTFTNESVGQGGGCPDDTVIGVSTPIFTSFSKATYVPTAVSVPIYNLAPATGEPARFGFILGGVDVPIILDTSVRTGGDYGVVVTVPNIPQKTEFIGSQVTFWGVPADPRHDSTRGVNCLHLIDEPPEKWEFSCPVQEKQQPFLVMPTSCTGPLHTTLEGDSWAQPSVYSTPRIYESENSEGETYGLDGCNRLGFEPSIKVVPDGQQASTPSGLAVDVHVPQSASLNPTGLGESNVEDTTVTLPAGMALNPAGADGLASCGLGEIALESAGEQTCPEAAKVGTVEIKSPLLPNQLVGAAYLAAQNANPFGSLVALYLVARDPVSGVLIKVAGQVAPDPVSGQLVSTFKNTPQLPFEDLSLHFFGGSRAPLGTPALCGGYTSTASIAPWSGDAPVQVSSEFDITSGPNGGPCHDPLPFAPSLAAGTTSIQAGGFSPFRMTMSRGDGEQNLRGIQLHMPPGLLGTLSTVKLCGEAQANAGTCGPESLVGHTIVSVGLGGNPYTVTGGEVFITGPYAGAPFGLSIVNPAKAGPFDLGKVVVRAKIEVDPTTSALTITTDESGPYKIPTIIDGIPLQIKHVSVTIDRPDFTFNPTNCNPLAIAGTLGSAEGATAALSVPLQVTNCAVLAFKPKLTANTSAKTSRANGASLHVKLTYPAGPYDANIARVKVELPKALPSRLTTLQKACLAQVFEANPANCPAASIVGHASATTPVLPVPLTGPAYFVSHGGEAFPSLIVVLQGYGVTVHLVGSTYISKQGITSSTFKTVPDVPVGSFELTLPQGPFSALTANTSLCKVKSLAMPTEFVGQNGALIKTSTKIGISGCGKTAHKRKARRKRAHPQRTRSEHGRRKA